MIIKDGIEFHAAELRPVPGIDGVLLTRVPAEIGNTLNERARHVVADSVATEMRFVTDAPNVRIYLSALKPEFGNDFLEVKVLYGNFESQILLVNPGEVRSAMLNPPAALTRVKDEFLRKDGKTGFAPNVWRLVPNRGGAIYCGIDTFGHEIRPPKPEEKPALTCLCYGSSITNSTFEGYPTVLGKRLGIDIINIGLSGACACETNLADWMASRDDWDLATLELGINMIGGYTPEEFQKRVDYLLDSFVTKNPKKPIFLITIYPSVSRAVFQKSPEGEDREAAFCKILRELYQKYAGQGNLHLIEGDEILDDLNGLSADFLHPRVYGHAVMGFNLAEKIRPYLKSE